MTETADEILFEEGAPKSERVDPSQGTFLRTARFFEGLKDGKLRYPVLERMDAAEFYRRLGEQPGVRSVDALSDDLVRAFDGLTQKDARGNRCLYMFVLPDGRQIHQHST